MALRILITQRVDVEPAYNERRDGLDQAWQRTFDSLTGELTSLWPLVNSACHVEAALDQLSPSLIVLSGGGDVGVAPERDETETQLLEAAAHRRIPVLGVCRGMQMMQRHIGGGIMPVSGHVGRPHYVSAVSAANGPSRLLVNSFHNFGIAVDEGGQFSPLFATDGTVEAFRHRDLPWCGIMWHPERPGNEPLAAEWLAGQLASLLRQ